jgi:hypothetical protein
MLTAVYCTQHILGVGCITMRETENGKGQRDTRRITHHPFPSIPVRWLAGQNLCICNGQGSLQISCGRQTAGHYITHWNVVWKASLKYVRRKHRPETTLQKVAQNLLNQHFHIPWMNHCFGELTFTTQSFSIQWTIRWAGASTSKVNQNQNLNLTLYLS